MKSPSLESIKKNVENRDFHYGSQSWFRMAVERLSFIWVSFAVEKMR